jgi:uncharacterized protein (TIGR00369 family)
MSTEEAAGAPAGWGRPRSKTITWHDPLVTAAALHELSGLEALAAIRDGLVAPPPIATHFDFAILDLKPGEIRFACTPDESAYNPIGMVHGGLVCTLLDTVLGCAVHTTLPARVGYTSIEIKVNYLRPVRSGAELTARGWVTKPGRRVAFADGEVLGSDGKQVATASGSCLIMSA